LRETAVRRARLPGLNPVNVGIGWADGGARGLTSSIRLMFPFPAVLSPHPIFLHS
jgi:hypothetical protein